MIANNLLVISYLKLVERRYDGALYKKLSMIEIQWLIVG